MAKSIDEQIENALETLDLVMCGICGGSGMGSSGDTQSTCDNCGGGGGVWSEGSFNAIKSLIDKEVNNARIDEVEAFDTMGFNLGIYINTRLARLREEQDND